MFQIIGFTVLFVLFVQQRLFFNMLGRDTLAHTALAKALQAIDVLTLGVGV